MNAYVVGPSWHEWYSNATRPRFKNKTLQPRPKHKKGDPEVHLIRIQKTGGTTFGEKVMPKYCGSESRWCSYLLHSEWKAATKYGRYHGQLVTFLRHPVERTLSEYFFLRNIDGMLCASQPQWDFHNLEWLHAVQREASPERAMKIFFEGFQHTPVRNRQALYIIGFDREGGAHGGEVYDWAGNHTALLEEAKDHLSKTIFGITDCFETSLKVVTDALGWNSTEALKLSRRNTIRKTDRRDHISKTAVLWNTRLPDFLNQSLVIPVSTAWNHTRPPGSWRSYLPPKLVNYIENWNAVDMELYEYALRLFKERYNRTCM